MVRTVARSVCILAGFLALWAGVSAPTEAGLFPWEYSTYYGPAFAANSTTTTTWYGPVAGSACGTPQCGVPQCGVSQCGMPRCCRGIWPFCGWRACNPCRSACSPCGLACGGSACGASGCASGNCGLNSGIVNSQPVPDPISGGNAPRFDSKTAPQKTFQDPIDKSPAPGAATGTDSGFKPAKKGTASPSGETDAFKPPVNEVDLGNPGQPSRRSKVGPAPQIDEPDAKDAPEVKDKNDGALHGPPLNLDEKITWRPAAQRERLPLAPQFGNARLVRRADFPKSEWVPVSGNARLASN